MYVPIGTKIAFPGHRTHLSIIRLEGDYEYSLVGTPDRKYLWVLTRAQQADGQRVQALLDYAGTLGFPVEEVIRTR